MAKKDVAPPAGQAGDRRRRLAEALRENLRRRKAAGRKRAGDDGTSGETGCGGPGPGDGDGDD